MSKLSRRQARLNHAAARASNANARSLRDSEGVEGAIVRETGSWSWTPLDSQAIEPRSFEEVRSFGSDAPRPPDSADLRPDVVIEPVEPLVLPVLDGKITAVAPGGDHFAVLDDTSLLVLDALDSPKTPLALSQSTGADLAAVLMSVSRLVERGCAEIQVPAALRSSPADEPISAPRRGDPTMPDLGRAPTDERPRPLGVRPLHPLDPERIPVIAVHLPRFGPPLALGMILAHARTWEGGWLTQTYELRPIITVDEASSLLAEHAGPGIILCSNYVWSYRENLRFAKEAAELNPDLIFVHGGPHTPKYHDDQEAFFERPGVHIAAIGEGEQTAVELLAALARSGDPSNWDALADVPGLVYRDRSSGDLVRTSERDRISDLDALPSPYLSGEFDDLHPATWSKDLGAVTVTETNRGCPYKCTFCDWGSATMSRIRKFSMDRVTAELDWLATRGLEVWMVADANFGILPRDVDIATHIVSLREQYGVPEVWGVNTAKNSTKNLSRIISQLCEANITTVSSLALQTRDPHTLSVIERSNISSERYDELALTFRRLQLPILCDLIVGLPGATLDSFKADLQWCFDQEITPRAWVCQVLPNAPMNAPAYRQDHGLVLDETDVVIASDTFSAADRSLMMGLRMAERTFEHLGLLRHVLRYLQWDHGQPAMDVLLSIVIETRRAPERFPLLAWTLQHLDGILAPPGGWRPFYREVRRFVTSELGIPDDPALDTVIAVQFACMPDRRRTYPSTTSLPHDYVAYYHDATAALRTTGQAGTPSKPLAAHPPGDLTVSGDPARLAESFCRLFEERPPDLLPGRFWHLSHLELDSPLTRWVNEASATAGYRWRPTQRVSADAPGADISVEASAGVPVELVAKDS
jgi:hypothetical protein